MDACVFCRIVAGELPAQVVYEDDAIMAFEDLHPEAPVHLLLIPKKHIASLAHLQAEDGAVMAQLMLKSLSWPCKKAWHRALKPALIPVWLADKKCLICTFTLQAGPV